MTRVSGLWLWSLLAGAACAGQPADNPGTVTPLPDPRTVQSGPSESIPLRNRALPPPAPAVVDPRSGAWRQHRGYPEEAGSPVLEEGVAIGVGRKLGVWERFHPRCPCKR